MRIFNIFLNLYFVANSSRAAIVSPRNDFQFNSSNAIIEPLVIFGKNSFSAILVAS